MKKKQIWMIFLVLLIGISIVGIVTVSAEKNKVVTKENTVPVPALTVLNTDWVHGTAFNVEFPSRIYRTDVKGWGKEYWGNSNSFNWFHIAIPTTVITDNYRNSLVKAFVLYKTTGGATITNIAIWDGPNLIKEYKNLNLNGNHSTRIDSSNTFVISPPKQLSWGLVISVGVRFNNIDPTPPASILFTTAGVDLNQ